MNKVYYNKEGWICNRYPYDIEIEDENSFIEVEDDVYNKTLECESYKSWRFKNGELFIDVYEETPIEESLIFEKQEIENWLIENDWIPNKIVTGEWEISDLRWINYLSQRSIKRARQDEINALLAQ